MLKYYPIEFETLVTATNMVEIYRSFIFHGEDSSKQFTETIHVCHPTIKFTAEWSKEEIKFLNVNIRLRNRQLETDLQIKPTDIHLFNDSTSCHPYRCKKSIP